VKSTKLDGNDFGSGVAFSGVQDGYRLTCEDGVMAKMRYTWDGEPLPGSGRDKPKYPGVPIANDDPGVKFPFYSWATQQGWRLPDGSRGFCSRLESAAEGMFVWPFITRPGVVFTGETATDANGTELRLQVTHGLLRIDAVVENKKKRDARLAIEIDGMEWHHARWDQVDKDYLRQRRITALGYCVVRFTSRDVFHNSSDCWKQIDAILDRREASF
jgi:very-short-patch-repair endonuclease